MLTLTRFHLPSHWTVALEVTLAFLLAGFVLVPSKAEAHITRCSEVYAIVANTPGRDAADRQRRLGRMISCKLAHVRRDANQKLLLTYAATYRDRYGKRWIAGVLISHFDCNYPPDNNCHRGRIRSALPLPSSGTPS